MKSLRPLIGIVLFTSIFISVYWYFQTDQPNPTEKREKVRLALAKALITAPVLIAIELDYYLEEGIDLEIVGEYASGKASFKKMLDGDADISTPATTPVVFNSFNRQDYAVFLTYTTTYEGVKIVARIDKGIRKSEDLKGKKIGVVRGTISQIMMDTFLAYNKISLSEVSIKFYTADTIRNALITGEVDAISVWEPHASIAFQELKEKSILIPSSKVYRIAINLAAMKQFIVKKPKVITKIVKATGRAIQFMKTQPEKSKLLLKKILNMDENIINQHLKDIQFNLALDQLLLNTMENEANWAIRHKITDENTVPNYLNYIYYQALEDFKPDAVTIIRKTK